MRKARAKKDRVLKPFLEQAASDLEHTTRFKVAKVIRKLDIGPHRKFVHDNLPVVRRILEDTFGTLTPIGEGDVVAGRGIPTIGYARAVEENKELIDESLTIKQGIVNGKVRAHNNLAVQIDEEDGEHHRPILSVEVLDEHYLAKARTDVQQIQKAERERVVDDILNPQVKLTGLGEETKKLARRALLEMFKDD